jgi:Histidine kinase-, DNA gyrase B-, and HSP90-like ATPase.
LAIVRHILQAHGARYELQSQPGVGTVVRFWLRR